MIINGAIFRNAIEVVIGFGLCLTFCFEHFLISVDLIIFLLWVCRGYSNINLVIFPYSFIIIKFILFYFINRRLFNYTLKNIKTAQKIVKKY